MKLLSTLALGVLIVVSAGSVAAQDDNAKKIVGKWEVSKSEDLPAGATVEFTKDGKLIVVAVIEKNEIKLDGTYKVEKNKLITKITFGGQTVEDTDEILKLDDTTLEVQDKEKKTTTLKRKK